jgi:hypothetical protein
VESEIARAAIETPHGGDEASHILNVERVRLEPFVHQVGRPAATAAALRGVRPYRELIGVLPPITVSV